MELDETSLKERFKTAVTDVSPDVVTLVTGGQELGRSVRRRRRIQVGASALVASALAVTAVAYFGDLGLLENESAQPADTSPTGVHQLVDATPRGLAAAVSDILGLGTPIAVGGDATTDPSGADQLQAATGYSIDGAKVEVEVIATSDVSQWANGASCDKPDSAGDQTIWCDDKPLDDGTPAIRALTRFVDPSSGADQTSYMAVVAVKRDTSLVAAVETLPSMSDQPAYTADTLPVTVDALTRLVSDPRVGFSTTEEYNAAGLELEGFKNSLTSTSSGSGSSSRTAVDKGATAGPLSSPR